MIIVEEQLTKAFGTLPTLGGYPEIEEPPTPAVDAFSPVYKWGNEAHLTKQIKLFNEQGSSPYPLIYQLSNTDSDDVTKNYTTTDLVLILATRVIATDLLNENRWAMSYQNVLWPLAKNIETLFKKSQMFVWDGEFKKTTYPNYGGENNNESDKKNFTIDIWDALKLEFKGLKITNNCLGNFKY